MSTTISAAYESKITVTETFSEAIATDNTATFAALNQTGTLTASSTVPATKHATFDFPMTAGSATINLAALTGVNSDEVVVGTGLKVQALKFTNKPTNANAITIAEGAANGYALMGAFTITLQVGQSVLFLGNDAAPDVAAGDRLLDITGTGSQVLQVHVVLG